MSILTGIRALYEEEAKRQRPPTGNPTGSRFGTCAAQLQMLRCDVPVEPPQPRSLMTWEEGNRTEEWLSGVLNKAFPGIVGLRQEIFYMECPLASASDVEIIREQINTPRGQGLHLWGTIVDSFNPPTIRVDENGRVKLHLLANKKMGFVLDLSRQSVWAPTYVDFVINHPTLGLTVIEAKSMSEFAFRRAVLGDLDYSKRCQLVGIAEATKANVVLIAYRKNTAHLATIEYLRGLETVRVQITRSGGQQEVFFAKGETVTTASGEATELPHDTLWSEAEVWTPFDESLVEAIRERIRRVLLVKPGEWYREYGPAFICRDCGGAGEVTCRNCHGAGISKRSTKGKTCGRCNGALIQDCKGCGGAGSFEEVEFGFPCSYAISPDTQILLPDFSHKPAGKVEPGDELLAVTEFSPGQRRDRQMVRTHVIAVDRRYHDTLTINTQNGSVTCSPEHPWLAQVPSRASASHWRRAKDIKPGYFVCFLTEPTNTDPDTEQYMGGYIRGLVEGDGTIQQRELPHPIIRVAMCDLEPLERLTRYLQYFGIRSWIEPFSAYTNRKMFQVRFGGKVNDSSCVARLLLEWPLDSYESSCGYLGGLYDAEGSLGKWSIRIHQVAASSVVANAQKAIKNVDVKMYLERWRRGTRRHIGAIRMSSKHMTGDLARLFSKIRPCIPSKIDVSSRALYNLWVPVESVTRGHETELIDIQTESKTFIAGGFVSHNCTVVRSCYPFARLEIDEKPHWKVSRADWEASGLSFVSPDR